MDLLLIRYKVAEKARRSQMQQLLGQLAVNKYIEWRRSCADIETVTDLFFAHPTSLNLLRAFPKVLLMDCTYKTNRYRLPFLENRVAADGNCGFRAIAGLMGFGEEGWLQVRKDLLKELHTHSDYYRKLFGSQERIDDLTNILASFEPNPGLDRWMTMPDMGHLISSFCQVVLVHLFMQQCLTFLSLRSIPTSAASRKEISHLEPGHPIPPIATNWQRYHDPCAIGWKVAYSSRVQHFKSLISLDVATIETVDLDED
ncbi:uncharacterized protein LOC114316046 [Camellia sinensis]|uniref:uncharacterized protein LOC114316046 n=1 Tax=Camellia sinensis TaxID=4442 RepID=UPI0010369FEB|nr:uncharacterized protein LOC114316046 [Camellia sinensis]